jgi:predicted NBD/HSP70 family sugar kinase
LLELGLVSGVGGVSRGGRRPSVFSFNPHSGVILAAGLGATHSRLAVTDLAGVTLVDREFDLDIELGPEAVLSLSQKQFTELLDQAGVAPASVRGVGVGVPAPVESATGKPVQPPIMPGWDSYPIRDRLAGYDVPVLVDNDVNLMALGEQRTCYQNVPNLLFVKVATGIGGGIIVEGRVYRGADGSAGDVGHVHIAAAGDALCRCGKVGCLEAIASGGAIARRLSEQGIEASTARDVVELVNAGNMRAIELVRESGRLIGEVLGSAVNILNPRVVVIGGDLAQAEGHLMPGIRELVYQRSISLATGHVRIAPSHLDNRAEVIGAALMAIDHVFSPAKVDEAVTEYAV